MSRELLLPHQLAALRQVKASAESIDAEKELVSRAEALDAEQQQVAPPPAPAAKRAKKSAAAPRGVPPPQERFADAALSVTHAHGKYFMNLLTRMGCFGTDITLDFEADALFVREVSELSVVMAILSVPKEAFVQYNVPCDRTFILPYKQVVKFAKTVTPAQTLTLVDPARDEFKNVLCARVHSSRADCTRGFKLLDSTTPLPVLAWETYVYPARATMKSSEFAEFVRACKAQEAEFLEFSVDGASLLTTVVGNESYDVKLNVDAMKIDGNVEATQYSIEYLSIVAGLEQVTESMTMYFGVDAQPLRCEFVARPDDESTASTINVLLMGRVAEDVDKA